ncbi:transporter [Bacillus sp. FJAT-27264]|uniref:DMT family transporter n=1 Tax=Paenibacillus sp. (strain DSM 101736 / FJAT-27264) TaxID=1850362 RepID=UPI000807DDCB|nr:DMT family transporter [Bacillus sp. FJAT-27264]OBZ11905.1 transporter [Bacillus sp. FJAT-27264]
MKRKHSHTAAYLAAMLYAVIIGFSFLFVKITVTMASPLDVLAHRFTIGWMAVALPFLFGWARLRMNWHDMLGLLLLGLLSPVMFFAFQGFGLMGASSSEAGIIMATVPLFTAPIAAFFLKEVTNLVQKLSILLSVSGVVLIFLMKGEAGLTMDNIAGLGLLLLSALSMAGYNVLARPLARKYSPLEISFVTLTMGCILFVVAALLKHGSAATLTELVTPFSNPKYLLSLLYLGILSTVFSNILSTFALSRLEASKVSVFNNLSTLISILAGALILHEALTFSHIIGTAMIIVGVLGTNFGRLPWQRRSPRMRIPVDKGSGA